MLGNMPAKMAFVKSERFTGWICTGCAWSFPLRGAGSSQTQLVRAEYYNHKCSALEDESNQLRPAEDSMEEVFTAPPLRTGATAKPDK